MTTVRGLMLCFAVTISLAEPSKHQMIKNTESLMLNRSPVIITKLDQAYEFRSIEIVPDSVVAYSRGGAITVFGRDEIAFINEWHSNHVLYTLAGGLLFGSLGYLSTPDEPDALADPEYWGVIYGALGAGLGFSAAVATSGLYFYYFDKELYLKYGLSE